MTSGTRRMPCHSAALCVRLCRLFNRRTPHAPRQRPPHPGFQRSQVQRTESRHRSRRRLRPGGQGQLQLPVQPRRWQPRFLRPRPDGSRIRSGGIQRPGRRSPGSGEDPVRLPPGGSHQPPGLILRTNKNAGECRRFSWCVDQALRSCCSARKSSSSSWSWAAASPASTPSRWLGPRLLRSLPSW